LYLVKWSKQ